MMRLAQTENNPPLDDDRTQRFALAVVTMLETLSPKERSLVLQRATEMLRPIPAPRAGHVLEAVVLAFPQRKSWTVDELKEDVEAQGVTATPKEIYNAVGYLVRKGRIRRVGYGQYVFDGAGVELDEKEDGTIRGSEHYD